MTRTPAGPVRVRRAFTRYTLGSVAAFAASWLVLTLLYGLRLAGPEVAAVAAWTAGAVVNYVLNRRWAWNRRGRAPVRELLPYWLTAFASLIIGALATGAADRLASEYLLTGVARVAFVGAAYLGTYGVLFLVKFCLFHYIIFSDRSADGESSAR
ncbi:GtrA family protein [Rhizohabitans arisaemae]|uniref:GtrA family protein n=1 Tax=Rhizohabitans arisaemae TaxID=2720610 RepID=UPI0024B14486|nr:GtrA family protein [Rhizohabitans arisaemae]